ncbi:MAG: DUF1569 domain-containing protein [Bacteroidota bacterium]
MKRKILVTLVIIISLSTIIHFRMNSKDPDILLPLIKEIESLVPLRDRKNIEVSQADVAWQLDHSLKVINRISDTLERSNPADYKSSINPGRIFVLGGGYIPRGRAQSPDVVRPPEIIWTEDLYEQIREAINNIEVIKDLPDDAHFSHFAFGQMNKGQTIRFLEVHTKHHLKIVKDIVKE